MSPKFQVILLLSSVPSPKVEFVDSTLTVSSGRTVPVVESVITASGVDEDGGVGVGVGPLLLLLLPDVVLPLPEVLLPELDVLLPLLDEPLFEVPLLLEPLFEEPEALLPELEEVDCDEPLPVELLLEDPLLDEPFWDVPLLELPLVEDPVDPVPELEEPELDDPLVLEPDGRTSFFLPVLVVPPVVPPLVFPWKVCVWPAFIQVVCPSQEITSTGVFTPPATVTVSSSFPR